MGILLADLRNRLPDAGVIGLCELPEFTVRRCLEAQGLSPDLEVVVTHRGVNHQGWILGIEDRDGRDLLDPVLSGPVPDDPCFAGIAGRAPDEPGIPLCYLRLHREEGRRGWLRAYGRSRRGRGAELEDLSERIHAAHRAEADSRQLLAGRDTRWYDLAVGPLIASRLGVSSARLWVSAPQGGFDPDLPADAIMEWQTLVREARWLRSSAAPRHAAHTDLLRRVIAFDEACATSVRDPSERNVRAALAIHPWGLSSSFVGAAARRCLEVQSWATCSTD
jgi:alpha-galactosidase/6-phospho-beta-glucosidase family protein